MDCSRLARPPEVLSHLCPPLGRVLLRFLFSVALRIRLVTVSLLSRLTAASSPPPPPPPTFPVRCTSPWFLSNAPASLHPILRLLSNNKRRRKTLRLNPLQQFQEIQARGPKKQGRMLQIKGSLHYLSLNQKGIGLPPLNPPPGVQRCTCDQIKKDWSSAAHF